MKKDKKSKNTKNKRNKNSHIDSSLILEKKAKQWIDDNQTISEVSINLGFSELREFRRAFKKWTGHSPTEYKKTKLIGSVL